MSSRSERASRRVSNPFLLVKLLGLNPRRYTKLRNGTRVLNDYLSSSRYMVDVNESIKPSTK